jgi:hypothetical protein
LLEVNHTKETRDKENIPLINMEGKEGMKRGKKEGRKEEKKEEKMQEKKARNREWKEDRETGMKRE